MDYKEKYEAALERAKKTLESSSANEIAKTVVYYFFPELSESEDERIRKELITENKESYTFDSTGMRFPKDCFKAGAKWMEEKK